MFIVSHIVIDAHEQLAILVAASLNAALLGILLKCPNTPQKHIGVLHFINLAVADLAIDKVINSNRCSLHHSLELIDMSLRKCKTGK